MFTKKAALIILALLLVFGCVCTPAYAAEPVSEAALPEVTSPETHEADSADGFPFYSFFSKPYVLTQNYSNRYFIGEGKEEVVEDAKKGYWLYRSFSLYVEIKRITDKNGPMTYFVAEIVTKNGRAELPGFANMKKPGSSSLPLSNIAKNYKTVIAVNGDYMNRADTSRKGIIMRNGITYLNNTKADTLAFYPDGSLRVLKPKTTTPQILLNAGVRNTFSFGPTLINGGKIQSGLDSHRLRKKNPRTAVGMIAPNHYLLIVVDGRQKNYSVGMTLTELAKVFKQYGCQVAYNLDGGQSATMSFMGKNINKYGGSLTGQRKVPDALMFGYSKLVS